MGAVDVATCLAQVGRAVSEAEAWLSTQMIPPASWDAALATMPPSSSAAVEVAVAAQLPELLSQRRRELEQAWPLIMAGERGAAIAAATELLKADKALPPGKLSVLNLDQAQMWHTWYMWYITWPKLSGRNRPDFVGHGGIGTRLSIEGFGEGTYEGFEMHWIGANEHTISFGAADQRVLKLRDLQWQVIAPAGKD